MGRGRDQVGVFERWRDGAGSHQAADVSHVRQQVGVELHAQLRDTQVTHTFQPPPTPN